MFRQRMHKWGAVALGTIAAIGLASCEQIGTGASTGSQSAATIDIDGSSTTVLVTEAVTHEFRSVDPNVAVSLAITGTGGGFKRFCIGETDISNASRPIKQSELEMARKSGVEFIELPVAFDGLTIAVHKDNTWVDSLTVEELHAIFRENDPARRWSQVRPGWPDREISLWAPGQSSGTFDYFLEVVFPDKAPLRIGDISMSEDDHILVRGIAGDADAVGFFGFAYFEANRDRVRAVPIDGGNGPVIPTAETIRDGSYFPLSRPLFIYVNTRSLTQPHVRAFVEFYLDSAPELAEEVGYVALPESVYRAARSIVAGSISGTRWLGDDGEHIHASVATMYPEPAVGAEANAQ